MSDDQQGGHSASPRRRQEARRQGRVPRSREFVFAVVYAALGATLLAYGPLVLSSVRQRLRLDIQSAARPLSDPITYLQQYLAQMGWWLLPLLVVICLAVIVAHWVQHGPLWLPDRLNLDFGRLNPLDGLQRLWQANTVVSIVMVLVKAALLVTLAGRLIRDQWDQLLGLSSAESDAMGAAAVALLLRFGAWIGIGLLVWGGVDFAWQLFKHERDLQMTPDQLRDEVKAVHNDVSMARRRRRQQAG